VPYKLPRSIQVVVTRIEQGKPLFLLLRRSSTHTGKWQFVTGSLEHCENHLDAAVREVFEETGIIIDRSQLIDLDLVNVFEIAPEWRSRYEPGITTNEETCFALITEQESVTIDPREHDSFIWADYEKAKEMTFWSSSKKALERVRLTALVEGSSGPSVEKEVDSCSAE
jgi:dihydroneopterin triphosphate diphosphatase